MKKTRECPECLRDFEWTGKGEKVICGDPVCFRARKNRQQRAYHQTAKGQAVAARRHAKIRASRVAPGYVCLHCRRNYRGYHWKRGPFCTTGCKWDHVLLEHLVAMEASDKLLRDFGFERIEPDVFGVDFTNESSSSSLIGSQHR